MIFYKPIYSLEPTQIETFFIHLLPELKLNDGLILRVIKLLYGVLKASNY